MTLGVNGTQQDADQPKRVWEAIRDWIKTNGDNSGLDLNTDSSSCVPPFNFYAKDRLPDHVLEKYSKFTDFVSVFYKWLECEQEIATLDVLKDLDECPDEFLRLFKNVYAKGFPNKTFNENESIINFDDPSLSKIQVRNFLRYARDFYQLKSIEEAYDFFFSMFFAEEVNISYPKIYLHKCSEGNYLGASAGITTDPCYYWGDHYRQQHIYSNWPECYKEGTDDPYQSCIPIPFPEYGPTGPCYFNSDGELCWGQGGSFDTEGNQLYPDCDACGRPEKVTGPRVDDEQYVKQCVGCAPGHPCGIHYANDFGLLSGMSRIHDNKTWQNYSYLIDSPIAWDSYKTWVRSILHPAGLYVAGNYTVTDDFPQPGTTGEIIPLETPIIGHYTPYRISTSQNLRNNVNSTDLYPCGWNPYAIDQGISYSSQHIQDSSGLWYKHEAGTTAHDPSNRLGLGGVNVSGPLGLTGTTGGLAAAEYNVSFFRIFHHPNSWSSTVPDGTQFKDIDLGSFIYLTTIDSNSTSPNDAAGSSAGCGF